MVNDIYNDAFQQFNYSFMKGGINMDWLTTWWGGLDLFSQVLYCVSIPSTLILVIQTVLIIMGFGNGGPDVNFSDTSGFEVVDGCEFCDPTDMGDVPVEAINPADAGAMHLFTFQGIITFLCVFSWVSILMYGIFPNIPVAVIVGFVCGAAAMFGVAKIIQAASKLTQNGNIVPKNFLGETGTVYFTIPADAKGQGKINVSLGERYAEFNAITEEGEDIPSGSGVRIVDIRAENVLVVEKI